MSTINVQLDNSKTKPFRPRIVVFGIGGAGGNAINNMIRANLDGVEFVAANTDRQALELSKAENKLQLGSNITMGLGAGTLPEIGRKAAEESIDEIERYLEGANMLFITAGMGGGTGTGASPVIAKLAKEKGILTVGIVTKPFEFEGTARVNVGNYGIEELRRYVDTLMVISNQNLFKISNINTGFSDAFNEADDVLHNSVRSITDLITAPGLINLDFADVKTIIKKMGEAVMGIGEAEGESRVMKALEAAISNPLLNNATIEGAKGVIVNISGGSDMTMFEVEEVMSQIQGEVDPNANIILGTALNEKLEGRLRISIVATGINTDGEDEVEEDNDYDSPLEKFAKEQEYKEYQKQLRKEFANNKASAINSEQESIPEAMMLNEKAEEISIENVQFEEKDESDEKEADEDSIHIDTYVAEKVVISKDIFAEEEKEEEARIEELFSKREPNDSLYKKNLNTADIMDFFNPTASVNPEEDETRITKKKNIQTGIKKYNFDEDKKQNTTTKRDLSEKNQNDLYSVAYNRSLEDERETNEQVKKDKFTENNIGDQFKDEEEQQQIEQQTVKKEAVTKEKPKKESGFFGGLFRKNKSKSDENQSDLFHNNEDNVKVKIHSKDGSIKLDTLDNFNSDVDVEEDISDVPSYLRKKN